ncbi:response regulator [Bdellovibrionota bacterium FG-1]
MTSPSDPSNETTKLVITIDDDPEFNRLMEHRFSQMGLRVLTFTDPAEFLSAVVKSRPALVLIDLNLGEGMSGFDLIQQLREVSNISAPILVSSGTSEEKAIIQALEMGADDYIIKPPHKDDFSRKVLDLISDEGVTDLLDSTYAPVDDDISLARVGFSIRLKELSSVGLKLITPHLIRKGTLIILKGPLIAEIFPERSYISATVVAANGIINETERVFLIAAEFDAHDLELSQKARIWVATKVPH